MWQIPREKRRCDYDESEDVVPPTPKRRRNGYDDLQQTATFPSQDD
jgi:hypothetical protein